MVAHSLGEASPAHFVLEGRNPVINITYFVECPKELNCALAKAADVKTQAYESIPQFAGKLRDAPAFREEPKGFVEKAAFDEGSLTFEIGRDPDSFDPTTLNLIWTVPVDVVTSPIQLILALVMMTQIDC